MRNLCDLMTFLLPWSCCIFTMSERKHINPNFEATNKYLNGGSKKYG